MVEVGPTTRVVGDLQCQRDSYLQWLDTEVVSCSEYVPLNITSPKHKSASEKSPGVHSRTWLLEFSDSVLFPEGGGQPTDVGYVTAGPEVVPITRLERHGLKCVAYSPQPIAPGTPVRQNVDYQRRWDHMQQHTGQHLLSAIMGSMALQTLGWSMGAQGEMNHVELSRSPTTEERHTIQARCNEAIRSNLPITVETPKNTKADSRPDDYDKEKGVLRYIRIGDLDYNACCGTHMRQTSHIALVLLHHTQTIRSTNCRLFFSCGERAINLATASVNAIRSMAVSLSAGSTPSDVQSTVQRLNESVSDGRKKEKKLLVEIARYEGDRIKIELKSRKVAWCHRSSDGLDFINLVVYEVRDALGDGATLLASGEDKAAGSIVILGNATLVDTLAAKVKEIVSTVKGGGKGKWQGKVIEWKKGEIEALKKAVEGLDV